mmetsp:Transcript_23928/g.71202  ORF Transcript_23928/g.71202 Transcript_23928/m.71202 type:complete len:222 (-) Transcript_23928:37-702(-)
MGVLSVSIQTMSGERLVVADASGDFLVGDVRAPLESLAAALLPKGPSVRLVSTSGVLKDDDTLGAAADSEGSVQLWAVLDSTSAYFDVRCSAAGVVFSYAPNGGQLLLENRTEEAHPMDQVELQIIYCDPRIVCLDGQPLAVYRRRAEFHSIHGGVSWDCRHCDWCEKRPLTISEEKLEWAGPPIRASGPAQEPAPEPVLPDGFRVRSCRWDSFLPATAKA